MPTPIQWTLTLEDSVVNWISEGKPLRQWGRIDGNPSHDAVYDHEKLSPDFKQRIAHARELGEQAISEECLEIADDGSNDWLQTEHGKQLDSEHVNRSRLRIETRLKLLAKWNPRKWGDKQELNVTGSLDLASRLSAARERKDKE